MSKAGFMVDFDGAYVVAGLVVLLLAKGTNVVTRLRRVAKLLDLPSPKTGGRGRHRKYGKNRISIKKCATDRRGWQTIRYCCRGTMVECCYKTSLATSPIFGEVIRAVRPQYFKGNYATYASSDATMGVEQNFNTLSGRSAIAKVFHDVNEIWGAGE